MVCNFLADYLRDPALELRSFKRQLKTLLFAHYLLGTTCQVH